MSTSGTFECYTCPDGKACYNFQVRKANYPDCQAFAKAHQGWNMKIYSSKEACEKACLQKAAPIEAICWACNQPGKFCSRFLSKSWTCPEGTFKTQKECVSKCGYMPLNPPIQVIEMPPKPQPLRKPPSTWLYVLIVLMIVAIIAILVSLLFIS